MKRRRLVAPIFVVVGFAAAALAGEIYLRTRYAEVLQIHTRPQIYRPDERLGYRYIPNSKSRICIPSICKNVQINANGYSGHSFELRKNIGDYRVAVIAASHGTGIWLQGKFPFPLILDSYFENSNRRVEVLNFSVDGANRGLANLRLIEHEVLDYGPDLILMSLDLPLMTECAVRENYRQYVFHSGSTGIAPADIEETRARIRGYIDSLEESWASKFYIASYLVRALHRKSMVGIEHPALLSQRSIGADLLAFQTRRVITDLNIDDMSIANSIKEIERITDRVTLAGSRLVLFTYGEIAKEQAAPIADSSLHIIELRMPTAKRFVHRNDGHYNRRGHRVIARKLIPVILNNLRKHRTSRGWR